LVDLSYLVNINHFFVWHLVRAGHGIPISDREGRHWTNQATTQEARLPPAAQWSLHSYDLPTRVRAMAETTILAVAAKDLHRITTSPITDYQRLKFQAYLPTTKNRPSRAQLDNSLGKIVPSRWGLTQDGTTTTTTPILT
jgi:hypothetical protein